MPTYTLTCEGCGTGFELFRQRFLRDDERVCPECGAEARIVLTPFVTAAPGASARRRTTVHRIASAGCGCGGCAA